jgi:hypothetical protein
MKNVLKDIKLIKKILETQEVKFTVNGHTEYSKKEDGTYGQVLKVFKTNKFMNDNKPTASMSDKYGLWSMNVRKFGPSSVTLYTYDMLQNKTRGRIKYEDVTILKELS